jgi:hypothetical protein
VSQQFGRRFSLVVGSNSGGPALDLSLMHVHFSTRKSVIQTPNIMECRIWNLAGATVKTLTSQQNGELEFNSVVLQAGYDNGAYGVIFSGQVRYFRTGRENPTDTFLEIYAADGDKAYNYAVVNATLPPGSKQSAAANQINTAMSGMGVNPGNMPPPDTGVTYPRGKAMYGMAREYARRLGYNAASQWSIQEGEQQFLPRTGTLPGDVVVVNSATGMVGIPVQTVYGIEVTMLINPNVKYGTVLKINNKDIQTATLDLSIAGDVQNSLNQLGPSYLNADGLYKVIAGEYTGDTRGQPWFLKVWCVNVDSSTSIASVQAGWLPGP